MQFIFADYKVNKIEYNIFSKKMFLIGNVTKRTIGHSISEEISIVICFEEFQLALVTDHPLLISKLELAYC